MIFQHSDIIEATVTPPNTFYLSQNYPNPFNQSTTIDYELPRSTDVTIKVYNLSGQEIATLTDELKNAGYFKVQWDGKNDNGVDIASGFYFYRIRAKGFNKVLKMVLTK